MILTDRALFASTINNADFTHLVDVSDTSENPAGSSFKLPISQLKTFLENNIYSNNGTLAGARQVTQGGFALNFTGGNIGIGITPSDTDTRLHVQGVDTTSSNYVVKLKNSASTNLLSITNNGIAKLMDMSIGRGQGLLAQNTSLGVNALLNATTTGDENVAIGYGALQANITGFNNVAIGVNALTTHTGSYCVAVGHLSLASNTGYFNTAMGAKSLKLNTGGEENTSIGYESLMTNTISGYNTAIGFRALLNSIGTGVNGYNVAIGHSALIANTSGWLNVAIGSSANLGNTTGYGNVAIGHNALATNNSNTCVAIGYNAGYYETTASKLFIDNQGRSNQATGRSESLIFGEFDSTISNQRVTINGALRLHNFTATEGSAVTASNGDIIYVTSTNVTFTSVGFWGYENATWVKL